MLEPPHSLQRCFCFPCSQGRCNIKTRQNTTKHSKPAKQKNSSPVKVSNKTQHNTTQTRQHATTVFFLKKHRHQTRDRKFTSKQFVSLVIKQGLKVHNGHTQQLETIPREQKYTMYEREKIATGPQQSRMPFCTKTDLNKTANHLPFSSILPNHVYTSI